MSLLFPIIRCLHHGITFHFYQLIIKLLVFLIALVLTLGIARTWQMEHGENAKIFLGGSVPESQPDGFYRGTVDGYHASWLGKKFILTDSKGINVFDDGKGGQIERYSFITSTGESVAGGGKQVFRIDYNVSENPWWVRPILDEMVQVAPQEYLGKLEVRIIPQFPFTLGYFELKK